MAEEIRVLLARRQMTATELARLAGLKQPYISRRMTGEIAFDMDDLELIAPVLGVRVAELLTMVEEQGGSDIDRYHGVPVRSIGRSSGTRPRDTRPSNRSGDTLLVAA
jgi:transcriptional regulator with XRE-family HTH domain